MLTHNKHIFVRPKKVGLLWGKCLFGGKVLILGSIIISIRIGLFVYNFRRIFSDLKIFLVFLVDFLFAKLEKKIKNES